MLSGRWEDPEAKISYQGSMRKLFILSHGRGPGTAKIFKKSEVGFLQLNEVKFVHYFSPGQELGASLNFFAICFIQCFLFVDIWAFT